MKKIQLLSILMLSGAVLFGGKATAHKAKVNFNDSGLARSESAASTANLVIDAKSNGVEAVEGSLVTNNAVMQCPNKPGCTGCKCSKNVTTNSTDQKCDSCANAKWWKFWAKKKNCCSTKSYLSG